MTEQNQLSNTLSDIKQMMERSSRFISLSGLSGIGAGICALTGAWFAHTELSKFNYLSSTWPVGKDPSIEIRWLDYLQMPLLQIAILTFISAFIVAFTFTYLRSRKNRVPIWGATAQRLMLNVIIPMITGGFFLLKLIDQGHFDMLAPACLLFYGLALLNASKYTLPEIRYLSYCILLTGILSLWFMNYGLYFWAIGFGVFHIIYGIVMWWKYERGPDK